MICNECFKITITTAVSITLTCLYSTTAQIFADHAYVKANPVQEVEIALIARTTLETSIDLTDVNSPMYVENVAAISSFVLAGWTGDWTPIAVTIVRFIIPDSSRRKRRDEESCECSRNTDQGASLVKVEINFSFDIGTANYEDVKDEIKNNIEENMLRMKAEESTYIHESEEACTQCYQDKITNLLVTGDVSAIGSFGASLSLNYFTNDSFTNLIGNVAQILGAKVYVQAKWTLTSLNGKIQFYVKKCEVTSEYSETAVAIISQACFAQVVQAEPIGAAVANKLVIEKSQFKYDSFSFVPDGVDEQALSCDIQFCIVEDATT